MRRSLPLMPDMPSTIKRERPKETREMIRAQAFLRQTYPLSPIGEELRQRTQLAVQARDQMALEMLVSELPTVESPKLHLFAELQLSEERARELFGAGLADIQVTSGCSHDCSFCALSAEHKIQTMPFVAVLKIAEQKRRFDKEVLLPALIAFQTQMEEAGCGLESVITLALAYFDRVKHPFLNHKVVELYKSRERSIEKSWKLTSLEEAARIVLRLCKERKRDSRESEQDVVNRLCCERFMKLMDKVHQIGLLAFKESGLEELWARKQRFKGPIDDPVLEMERAALMCLCGEGFDTITNYLDSDPFDYKDATFVHEDGTSADYGDVFAALATPVRPVHVTTAGWRMGAKHAERAIEKIRTLCIKNPALMNGLRLSVSEYEGISRQDSSKYLESMKKVIAAMWDLGVEVMFFEDSEAQHGNKRGKFTIEVVEPLQQFMKELSQEYEPVPGMRKSFEPWYRVPVSYFSGKMVDIERQAEEPDTGEACMYGWHVQPNGQAAHKTYQSKEERILQHDPYKGVRPIPTGERIFG